MIYCSIYVFHSLWYCYCFRAHALLLGSLFFWDINRCIYLTLGKIIYNTIIIIYKLPKRNTWSSCISVSVSFYHATSLSLSFLQAFQCLHHSVFLKSFPLSVSLLYSSIFISSFSISLHPPLFFILGHCTFFIILFLASFSLYITLYYYINTSYTIFISVLFFYQ